MESRLRTVRREHFMGYGMGNLRTKRGVGRCNSDLVDCYFKTWSGSTAARRTTPPPGGAQNGRGSFWFEGRKVCHTCIARYLRVTSSRSRKDFSHTTGVHMRHLTGEARRRGWRCGGRKCMRGVRAG
jgi:hypothetical protein